MKTGGSLIDNIQNSFVLYTILTSLFVILACFIVQSVCGGKKRKLPPGPLGFPLIGHLHLLGSSPHISTMYLASKFGKVFRIRLGSWPAIVVTGQEAVTEALIQKSADFAGRPAFFSSQFICDGKSLSFSSDYDERWKLHKKITTNVLRCFIDTNPIQEIIQEEASNVVSELITTDGNYDPIEILSKGVGSIIFQVLFGRGKNIREERSFQNVMSNNRRFNEFVKANNSVNAMPWLRHFVTSSIQKMKDMLDNIDSLSRLKIDEHQVVFSPEHLCDVTDGLLGAILANSDEMMKVGLTDKEVMYTVNDFFGAGFGTVKSTLHWALLYMARYPNIQNKVHMEITQAIGINRLPTFDDCDSVPYTEATILEILRMSSAVPMSIPHATTRDTTLCGYDVPKGTVVLVNLYSLARCAETWGDPYRFRPDRFLNGDKINKSKADLMLPFSAGRRKCPGEKLSRLELFIFFSSIMQRCHILEPKNGILSMDGILSLTLDPQPYKIRCVSR